LIKGPATPPGGGLRPGPTTPRSVEEGAAAQTPARVWWSAVRPATLAASVAPVLVGTTVAVHEGGPRLGAGLLALLVGIAMQVGVNFANDYSDHVRGADSPRRVGPLRAASSGVIAPDDVKRAAIAAFGLAAIAGLALSIVTDWRLVVVGVACLLAGWLYTGGPRPYGYLGLGEVFVFIFFGLVATLGTVYVETLRVTPLAILMACAMGCFATAILILNNLRDLQTDLAAGKLTLATRIGRERTRLLLLVLVCVAFAIPISLLVFKLAVVTVMLVHFAIPIAAVPVRTAFATSEAPALVRALKRMAAAELAYALLFAFGLLL
jgi:1,4-dihydroxy-2-naphthoate octaprenyltransferase